MKKLLIALASTGAFLISALAAIPSAYADYPHVGQSCTTPSRITDGQIVQTPYGPTRQTLICAGTAWQEYNSSPDVLSDNAVTGRPCLWPDGTTTLGSDGDRNQVWLLICDQGKWGHFHP
jgi:hypothetical protein